MTTTKLISDNRNVISNRCCRIVLFKNGFLLAQEIEDSLSSRYKFSCLTISLEQNRLVKNEKPSNGKHFKGFLKFGAKKVNLSC